MTKKELKTRLEIFFPLKENILWKELLSLIPDKETTKSGAVTKVEEFHKAFGHPISTIPFIPSESRCHLRKKLILEEASEFVVAVDDRDLVEVADAICDLLYVVYGAAIEFGLGDIVKEMFAEVHRSNMSKLGEDGKPITREDGKTIKGPNFSPPDLQKIITHAKIRILG